MTTAGLSHHEHQVIAQMRKLSTESQEWRLVISSHPRQPTPYLKFEQTVFRSIPITPDPFLAVE